MIDAFFRNSHCKILVAIFCSAWFLAGCKPDTTPSEAVAMAKEVKSIPLKSSLYSAEIENVNEDESIYRLYRKTEEGRRLVTEAYLCNEGIDTLLPTPFGWGCVVRGMAGSSEVLAPVHIGGHDSRPTPFELTLQSNGLNLRGGKITRSKNPIPRTNRADIIQPGFQRTYGTFGIG